ncbi:MAG: M23 family metallopeptidase [Rectinemataceae bacterium]
MPEGLRRLKEQEKQWYRRLVHGVGIAIERTRSILVHLLAWGRTSVVFAVIPQSDQPARRIRTSRFVLVMLTVMAVMLLGAALVVTGAYGALKVRALHLEQSLARSEHDLQRMRDGIEDLLASTAAFEARLGETIQAGNGPASMANAAGPDTLYAAGLSALLAPVPQSDPVQRDLDRLKGIAQALQRSTPELDRIEAMIANQKSIMTEIPNLWPIKGNAGHISMYFGQNENPFADGQWYLHTGIDISTFRIGDPVVATADGKVIEAGYAGGMGNTISIQHAHGFTTRYGHLRGFAVKKGQQVKQGEVIGWLGNSGKTTGPHLHYEIYLGTSLIDPLRFLSIRKEFHE